MSGRSGAKERLLAAGLGALLFLVFIEVALRLLGAQYPALDPGGGGTARVQIDESTTRVLCVGDSFTYGIGASPGADFPAQLEARLSDSELEARVFNAGMPGANTGFILEALPRHLMAIRPQVVVVLAGGANMHNLFGLRAHRRDTSWIGLVERAVFEVRVLRLASYGRSRLGERSRLRASPVAEGYGADTLGPEVYARWRARIGRPVGATFERGAMLMQVGDVAGARAAFEAGAEDAPDDAAYQWALGKCAHMEHDLEATRRAYERAIALDPGDAVSHYSIGDLYQDSGAHGVQAELDAYAAGIEAEPSFPRNHCALGRHEATRGEDLAAGLAWFQRGLEGDPEDPGCYAMMEASLRGVPSPTIAALLDGQKQASARAVIEYALALEQDVPNDEVTAWIQHDLLRIVALSEEVGARVILQTYPQPTWTNDTIRRVAGQTEAPLVDMEYWVRRLASQGVSPGDLLLPDGHYSDQGNREVAEQLAERVLALEPVR